MVKIRIAVLRSTQIGNGMKETSGVLEVIMYVNIHEAVKLIHFMHFTYVIPQKKRTDIFEKKSFVSLTSISLTVSTKHGALHVRLEEMCRD